MCSQTPVYTHPSSKVIVLGPMSPMTAMSRLDCLIVEIIPDVSWSSELIMIALLTAQIQPD